jgi:hypothetical protein
VSICNYWDPKHRHEVVASMQELSTELEHAEGRKEKKGILVSLSGCGLLST